MLRFSTIFVRVTASCSSTPILVVLLRWGRMLNAKAVYDFYWSSHWSANPPWKNEPVKIHSTEVLLPTSVDYFMTSLPTSVEFKITGVASSVESKVNPGHSLVSNSPNPFLKNIDKHFYITFKNERIWLLETREKLWVTLDRYKIRRQVN